MSSHAPSANSGPYKLLRFYGEEVTTQIDFVLPNVRTEIVARCGKYFFSNRTTVTPIERDRCRLDFVAAWNLSRWFPVTPFLRFFGKRFHRAQDQDVIQRQQPGLKVQPRMMLIDDADRQARWYFQLKAAYLESQQTECADVSASARWAGDAALAELKRRTFVIRDSCENIIEQIDLSRTGILACPV